MSIIACLAASALLQAGPSCLVELPSTPQIDEELRIGPSPAANDDWIITSNPIAGAPGTDRGVVYIFRRGVLDDDVEYFQTLTPPPGMTRPHFGQSIDIEGDLLAVSAPGPLDTSALVHGRVFLFRFDGTSWLEETSVGVTPLQFFADFGHGVALGRSGTHERLIVSAPKYAETGFPPGLGGVFVYEKSPAGWALVATLQGEPLNGLGEDFGDRIDFDGDYVVATQTRMGVGIERTFVFGFNSALGAWEAEAKFETDAAPAIEDGRLFLGCPTPPGTTPTTVEILQVTRDPATTSWTIDPVAVANIQGPVRRMRLRGDRLLIDDAVSRPLLLELDGAGNWQEKWRPGRIETEGLFVLANPQFTAALSRGQVVVAHARPLSRQRLSLADPSCHTVGSFVCKQETVNSTGRPGKLMTFGSPDVMDGDLTLFGYDLPPGATVLALAARAAIAPTAVGDPAINFGQLCLGGDIGRFRAPGQVMMASVAGLFSLTVDPGALPRSNQFVSAMAGETWFFQAWHRDVVGGAAVSNFTSARSLLWQ